MHVRKISSRDILDPYLAIGINQESAKMLQDSESRRRKLPVAGPSIITLHYIMIIKEPDV